MHRRKPVIASVGHKQVVFPTVTDVMAEFGLSSAQVERLIERGQNVPYTGITLDWYDGDPPDRITDVTCDMMSDEHLCEMERRHVKVIR